MTTLAKYTYLGLGTVVQVDYAEPDVRYDLVTGGSSTNPYGGLDRFGRVVDLLWQKYSGTPTDLVRIAYGYDRVSNRTYREDQVAPSGFDELYAYDGIHRLKDFDRGDLNANKDATTSPTLEQSWGLDTTGNWSTFEQNVPGTTSQDLTQSRTHNKVNEITDITETVGASWVTPQHDRNGNMTFMPQPAHPTEGFTATYDAWNRLVKLEEAVEPGSSSSSSSSSESSSSSSSSSESGSSSSSSSESQSSSSSSSEEPLVVTYAYDGQHWRTEKDVSGETTHFYYSRGWQCLEEREGTSTDPNNQYVWGLRYIDDLVLRDRDTTGNGTLDERLYGLQDDNWNVVAVANTSATAVERYAYSAYGGILYLDSSWTAHTIQESIHAQVYTFTGRRRDDRSRLYYYRQRCFHARLGRFLTRDPFRWSYTGTESRHSLYNYTAGNPIRRTDPFGLVEVELRFFAFIPKSKGDRVRRSPIDDVRWGQEPGDVGAPLTGVHRLFATDNREKADEPGTSRLYSVVRFDSKDLCRMAADKVKFVTDADASHQIHARARIIPRIGRAPEVIWEYRRGTSATKTGAVTHEHNFRQFKSCCVEFFVKASGEYPFTEERLYIPAPGIGGDAFGPLIDWTFNPAPSINYEATWTVCCARDGTVTVQITGSHNEFPAFGATGKYGSGKTILLYEDYPEAEGPGIFNLGVFWDDFDVKKTPLPK